MRGEGGVKRSQQWVQLYTGAQINFGDLTTYLTFSLKSSNFILGLERWIRTVKEYSESWSNQENPDLKHEIKASEKRSLYVGSREFFWGVMCTKSTRIVVFCFDNPTRLVPNSRVLKVIYLSLTAREELIQSGQEQVEVSRLQSPHWHSCKDKFEIKLSSQFA